MSLFMTYRRSREGEAKSPFSSSSGRSSPCKTNCTLSLFEFVSLQRVEAASFGSWEWSNGSDLLLFSFALHE